MEILTLKSARAYCWPQCSGLIYDESNTSEVARVNGILNAASLMFFSDANYRLSLQRAEITAYDSQVTLPRGLQTIEVARTDFGTRVFPHPIWYDLLGGCSSNLAGYSSLNDLGEGFCTFRDIPTDLPIVVRSEEAGDSTALLTVVVKNDDGIGQFTVPLSAAATQVNSPLTGVIQRLNKPITTGRIEIFYKQDGVETLIASMKPSETDANYRRYRVASNVTSVDAICKRCYVPAYADIEPMVPNNVLALESMVMALQFRKKNDQERYKEAKAEAFMIADSDRQQFDGQSQTPMYNVIPGFGAASIPNISPIGITYGNTGHYS